MSVRDAPPELPRLPPEDDLRRRVKRELRKRLAGVRRATPLDVCLEKSSRIIRSVSLLDGVERARSVALFWPIEDKHEVDLRAFDTELRARGVRVAYPAIVRPEESQETADPLPLGTVRGGDMTFHFCEPDALEERGFGFAEPPPGSPAVSPSGLDVIVVPALALDPSGQRIGYGAGYYDRALGAAAVLKIGVIFDFQLVSEVPALDGDVAVDWIVTDQRVLRAVRAEELCAPSTGGIGMGPCSR